jgi:hypothetical protein
MQRLIVTAVVLAMVGISPGFARGGHGHSGHSHFGHGHIGHSMRALSAPANPSVPPSLTSDPRLTGSAPLPSRRVAKADTSAPVKLDPEDAKLNQTIKNICRGC